MNINTICCIVVCVIAAYSTILNFMVLPSAKKIKNIKEWLRFAVTEAEKEFGSGTGQLKLRSVYDKALQQFPWIIKLVTFDEFSKWVDEALEWMNKQLSDNKAIKTYIN